MDSECGELLLMQPIEVSSLQAKNGIFHPDGRSSTLGE